MYKLVAIDIDGTLLNSNGELSMRTKETISRATDKNIKIVLTSARVNNSISAMAKMINADKYIVCDNGASIFDMDKKQTIWSKEFEQSLVVELIKKCIDNNIYYMVFTEDEIIIKDIKHMALAFYKQKNIISDDATAIPQFRCGGGIDYLQSVKKPIRRIVICDRDRQVYNSVVNKLREFDGIEIMAPPYETKKIIEDDGKKYILLYNYAEIIPKGANKWKAIEEIMKIENINKDEVIAIGDNFNDMTMIQNAGLGVAMNNGFTCVKDVADVVAPSNDDDGVAHVIERYILGKNN